MLESIDGCPAHLFYKHRPEKVSEATLFLSLVFEPASAVTVTADAIGWLVHLPALLFHIYGEGLRLLTHGIRDLFDSYGYWVIFLGMLFENTLFLGLVVPGVLLLLLAGISAGNGELSPYLAFLLALTATILGDTTSYLMGRFGWSRVVLGSKCHEFTE